MKSRTASNTRSDKRRLRKLSPSARFRLVVQRALARPLNAFAPMPVRSRLSKRGTSANVEAENPYFHGQEA